MKIKYYWNLIRGKTNALNPAKLNLKHIWAVFQCWLRSVLPTPEHIKQQIAWRAYMVKEKSPECWESGACIQCGCVIKDKITADIGCENEPFCYPPMMNKKDWEQFKEDKGMYIYKSKNQ